MVNYAPQFGEGPAEHRARVQREVEEEKAGTPAAPSGFEAQKAKVAAQHGKWAAGTPKKAVNLDTAADEDAEVQATHKRMAGGVKPLDTAAIKAADKDKEWAGKSAEEQQEAARSARTPTTPGAAHTSQTPGSSGQTSMGAALAKAGVVGSPKPAAPAPSVPEKSRPVAPSPAISAQNNMGAPRVQDNGASVVAGLSISPAAAAEARGRSTQGARKNGGVREKAATTSRPAGPSTPRAATESQQLPGGRFAGKGRAEMFAHVVGIEHGASEPLSARPATNPSPMAPQKDERVQNATRPPGKPAPAVAAKPVAAPATHAPVATSPGRTEGPANGAVSGGRFPASPEAQSRAPISRESLGAGKPKIGSEITYGVRNAESPTAKVRANYQAHIAGGGTTDSYWAERDAKKASKPAARAKAPKEAVVEESPAVTSRTPTPQRTPLSPQMSAAPAREETLAPSRGLASLPDVSGPSSALADRPEVPKATGRTRSTGRVGSVSATAGEGAPAGPRPGTVSAARGGGVSGGEHSVNVGGDNHGQITVNHNTYNTNYGHVGGNLGNVDHGYAPRGGSGGGGGGRGPSGGGAPPGAMAAGAVRGDAWVRDAHGHHHSISGTMDHLSGKTNGKGHTIGGAQKPLKGSARASSGGVNPAQMATPQGTGTTNNWQGPQAGVTHPASGIGTASHGQTPTP